MKNYFRFGSNFVLFDHVTAVKCSYYANQHCEIDQLLVYLEGGHDLPIPAMEQGRFLEEFQKYLDSFSDLFEEDRTEKQ
jgi:hypothetical protein